MSRPKTFRELQRFYCEEFRPLYDKFAATNRQAQEIHAEAAAALDHLMRNVVEDTGKISPKDCDRVAGHLKRATLDAFKLLYETQVRKPYERMMDAAYCDVEDGRFQPRINKLWIDAVRIVEKAREHEHLSDTANVDEWDAAFEEWKKILSIAETFKNEETSDKILRAKRNTRIRRVKSVACNLFWAIFSAVAGCLITCLAR